MGRTADETFQRALGSAVLRQAVVDAHRPLPPPLTDEERVLVGSVRTFLRADNPELELWCDLAGVEPDAFVQAARRNGAAFAAMPRQAVVRQPRVGES